MKKILKETIYRQDSALLKPKELLQSMIKDLVDSRELAMRLLSRNIKAQYRQTVLGYLWAFLPPLFITVVWVFLNSQKILNVEDTGMPYPVFVLTGTVLWQTFVDSINSPMKVINESRSMLVKINFPREALILAGLGEVIFNFMIRLLLLIGIFIYYKFPLPGTVVLLPVGVLSLISMGMMIGLLLTPLSVLYNDIGRGIQIVTQAWFFLTPVIYPVPNSSLASTLIELNPVTPLLVSTRDWITTGSSHFLIEFVINTTLTVLLLFIGWLFYRLAMPHLISRISA